MYRIKFKLPQNIPSSFYYKDENAEQNPKAKIKYYCKASFLCQN